MPLHALSGGASSTDKSSLLKEWRVVTEELARGGGRPASYPGVFIIEFRRLAQPGERTGSCRVPDAGHSGRGTARGDI